MRKSSLVKQAVDLAIETALGAGEILMGSYAHTTHCEIKSDGSPVTKTDLASHQFIVDKLSHFGLPVVSEESADMHFGSDQYWLVDPLDGTKDYLAKNDEFTVNIALVVNSRSILGVVYAPAKEKLFWGYGAGTARVLQSGRARHLRSLPRSEKIRMVNSRFHDCSDVRQFALDNQIDLITTVGSALKFCYLASGDGDVFPRLVGSSEWDTAAGQAILEAAGGRVVDWDTGYDMRYGKARRRNRRFLAFRGIYDEDEFCRRRFGDDLL